MFRDHPAFHYVYNEDNHDFEKMTMTSKCLSRFLCVGDGCPNTTAKVMIKNRCRPDSIGYCHACRAKRRAICPDKPRYVLPVSIHELLRRGRDNGLSREATAESVDHGLSSEQRTAVQFWLELYYNAPPSNPDDPIALANNMDDGDECNSDDGADAEVGIDDFDCRDAIPVVAEESKTDLVTVAANRHIDAPPGKARLTEETLFRMPNATMRLRSLRLDAQCIPAGRERRAFPASLRNELAAAWSGLTELELSLTNASTDQWAGLWERLPAGLRSLTSELRCDQAGERKCFPFPVLG